MNINIKALLASTLLTVLFTSTTAIAGDNDHFIDAEQAVTKSVLMQKVSLQTIDVETAYVGVNR